jgi:hypothetical protein
VVAVVEFIGLELKTLQAMLDLHLAAAVLVELLGKANGMPEEETDSQTQVVAVEALVTLKT